MSGAADKLMREALKGRVRGTELGLVQELRDCCDAAMHDAVNPMRATISVSPFFCMQVADKIEGLELRRMEAIRDVARLRADLQLAEKRRPAWRIALLGACGGVLLAVAAGALLP